MAKRTSKAESSKKAPSSKKKTAGKKKTSKTTSKKAPVKKTESKKTTTKKASTTKKTVTKKTTTTKQAPTKGAASTTKKKTTKTTKKVAGSKADEAVEAKAAPRFKRVFANDHDDSSQAALRMAKLAGLRPVEGSSGPAAKQKRFKKLEKSPFSEKELGGFREILRLKRTELFGDVSSFETEALSGGGGGLSHMPQHLAEQGSDAADQFLNLHLAAGGRKLLKEIDDALARIDDNTYGICELLGKPIGKERLEHTPWARYSIEAARMIEDNPYLLRGSADDDDEEDEETEDDDQS